MDIRDDQLQQYFDSELDAEEAAKVREALEQFPELRLRLEALERLQQLVRSSAVEARPELNREDLFQNILRRAQEPEQKSNVVPLASRSEAAKKRQPAVWAAVAAVAAAALLAVWSLGAPQGAELASAPELDPDRHTAKEKPPVAYARADAPGGSEVEEVDFGHHPGTVFSVEGATGERIAVVWIND